MENWRERYDDLVSGARQPADCSVAELFELASCLAVNGDFAAKYAVYLMILEHPLAGKGGQDRVLVYHADMQRRNGHAGLALALLERIGRPEDCAALLDWLQAMGQCCVMQERYEAAIAYQRELIGLLDDTTLVDLRFYYLQTLAHLKMLANQPDDEVRTLLAQMDGLLAFPDFPAAKRSYSQESYLCLLGRWYGLKNLSIDAVGVLLQAYRSPTSVRQQANTAMLLLYYQIKSGGQARWFGDVANFYRDNKAALQPTDVVQYRRYYDLVEQHLADQPS